MKKIALPVLVMFAMFIAGCVVTSVYPYYTEKDLVFDPALLGKWISADEKEEGSWEFSKAGEKDYAFIAIDGNETNTLSMHLFKLGKNLFFDWCPDQSCEDSIPPHYLLKVEQTKPNLRLKFLDYDWLKELLSAHPNAVRHIIIKEKSGNSRSDRIVLTADTKELQKFVLKYVNDPKAFGKEAMELKRQETDGK